MTESTTTRVLNAFASEGKDSARPALIAPVGDVTALRELFTELLRDHDIAQRVADLAAGADIRYDMGRRGGGWDRRTRGARSGEMRTRKMRIGEVNPGDADPEDADPEEVNPGEVNPGEAEAVAIPGVGRRSSLTATMFHVKHRTRRPWRPRTSTRRVSRETNRRCFSGPARCTAIQLSSRARCWQSMGRRA